MNQLELYGAHRAPLDDTPDPRLLQARGLPRHRTRRRQWKPPQADTARLDAELQPVKPQHAYDRDTFVR